MKKHIPFILCCTLLFVSCEKEKQQDVVSIRTIHVATNAGNISTQINNTFNAGNLAFGFSSLYTQHKAGENNVRVFAANGVNVFLNRTFTVDAGKAYTALLFDSLPTLQMSVVEDDWPENLEQKSGLRFFHLLKGAPAVRLQINPTNTTVFTNRLYADQVNQSQWQTYQPVDTGLVQLQAINQNNQIIAQANAVRLAANTCYTVVLRGLPNGSLLTPFAPTLGILIDQPQ